MNRKAFYDAVRKSLFGKALTVSQVQGMEAILNTWEYSYSTSVTLEQLAYCLATAYHETDRTMQPIEEYGKGKGRAYGKPDPKTGKVYYGRGYVQLTWLVNYLKAKKVIGVDFVLRPELALDSNHAARIMFEGMRDGWFTGKKLSDYIGSKKSDYKNARRIINGTDRAELIATYAAHFLLALNVAR